MSAIEPVAPEAGSPDGAPSAPPALRRFVIASPESTVWRSRGTASDVLWLDPLREPDVHALGPLQPPNEGPPETAIPRWAVYDCAEVPGAVIGFLRTPVDSADDARLDPLSLVLATPMLEPGAWHLYGLTVRCAADPGEEQTLRLLTIETAMSLLDAERASLIVPWSSPLLAGLPALGPVEILAALTPLHGPAPAATVVLYRAGAPAPAPPEWPTLELPPRLGTPELEPLQRAIEAGRRLVLGARAEPDAAPGVRLCISEAPP